MSTPSRERPLKTVHVDDGRSWRGGQAQVWLLLRGLHRQGVEALLVAPPGAPLLERARAAGLPAVPLSLGGEWDVPSALLLARLLRRERADVVHAHTAHALTLAGTAGLLARTPLIVAARRVDFPPSRLGRLKLDRLADAVVAVSHGVERVLLEAGIRPERIEVVHSGIDPEAVRRDADPAALRAELGIGSAPLVGAVGALVDHKDHLTLVEAAARLAGRRPDAVFVIAGAGPLESELRSRIRSSGLAGRFHLLGFRRDVPSLLAALDVFVLCSHLEGLGTSVLDAMAAGAAVVASRVGGVPEMVDDGVSGVLVPPRDPKRLAGAIGTLLEDGALRARLRQAARQLVERHFHADRMVQETLELYRRRGVARQG